MVSMPQSAFTLCASGQKPVGQTDTVRHRQTDRWACTWVDGAKGQHADVRDGQTGRPMRGLQVHTLSISERFQYSPCLRACVHACACACVLVCLCARVCGPEVMKKKIVKIAHYTVPSPDFPASSVPLGQLMCPSLSPDVVIHDPARN